jgi:hypothetical protein
MDARVLGFIYIRINSATSERLIFIEACPLNLG